MLVVLVLVVSISFSNALNEKFFADRDGSEKGIVIRYSNKPESIKENPGFSKTECVLIGALGGSAVGLVVGCVTEAALISYNGREVDTEIAKAATLQGAWVGALLGGVYGFIVRPTRRWWNKRSLPKGHEPVHS